MYNINTNDNENGCIPFSSNITGKRNVRKDHKGETA